MPSFDYTLGIVALGAAVLGIVSGVLGTFAVLRRQSLLGDAIAHAALPGVALAFMLTGSKLPIVLMVGAVLAGWAATLLILAITETARVRYDSMLALMLSVFFGIGLVLLTFIQRQPGADQAGLDRFLFGQVAALVQRDLVTMAALAGIAVILVLLFWKEFKLLAFDPDFGRSLGQPVRRLDVALTALLVIAIVVGLQMVGVVLMSAMVIAPAAAARQWTDRLGWMVGLAGAFGAAAGISGALISSTTANLPTGPTIVLCISAFVVFSLLGAPNRGLLWRRIRASRQARRLQSDAVLLDLYALSMQHHEDPHPHDEAVLDIMSEGDGRTHLSLRRLAGHGFVRREAGRTWALTSTGLARARALLREREAEASARETNPGLK